MRGIAGLLVALLLCGCRDAGDDPSAELAQARKLWNDTYREPRTFPPSAFLSEVAKGLKPGRALDVGMGQGRNALYLASQGWRVTGVDISDEGIRQARSEAAARKLSIDAILHDIHRWDYGSERWDLVLLVYERTAPHRQLPVYIPQAYQTSAGHPAQGHGKRPPGCRWHTRDIPVADRWTPRFPWGAAHGCG